MAEGFRREVPGRIDEGRTQEVLVAQAADHGLRVRVDAQEGRHALVQRRHGALGELAHDGLQQRQRLHPQQTQEVGAQGAGMVPRHVHAVVEEPGRPRARLPVRQLEQEQGGKAGEQGPGLPARQEGADGLVAVQERQDVLPQAHVIGVVEPDQGILDEEPVSHPSDPAVRRCHRPMLPHAMARVLPSGPDRGQPATARPARARPARARLARARPAGSPRRQALLRSARS